MYGLDVDAFLLIRLRVGAEPPIEEVTRPDPREVDNVCYQMRTPDEYAARWIAWAAGIAVHDPDGHDLKWTRRQVRGVILMRHLYQTGRLYS